MASPFHLENCLFRSENYLYQWAVRFLTLPGLCFFLFFCPPAHGQNAEPEIVFNRDVRPILVDKCFACHGPDAKTVAADLRVDIRSAAIESGAIVPNHPDKSELVSRIFSSDSDEVMPPVETHKPLDDRERTILRKWIAEGANYEVHWAYTPLRSPSIPSFENQPDSHWTRTWPRNPIDQFVTKIIQANKKTPTSRAEKITLIRRLSFDLTGLPPTLKEVEAFLEDEDSDAYERLVDRLFASPRFGERMAIYWLDLVRYADTVGYHGDQDISQSPYRDYVINAFNENKPYDVFVREQLAGDLLPEPTLNQLIASGYNRLNQTTEEGGSQAKEYLAIYFADRVRNTSQVFLGATMGCAQCHDHKFDPFTMKDFYSFGAFFADIQEVGVYGARRRPPMIPVPSTDEKIAMEKASAAIKGQLAEIERLEKKLLAEQADWENTILNETEKLPKEKVNHWVNDSKMQAAIHQGKWDFVDRKASPVKFGKKARRQQAAGLVQHYFDDASTPVTIQAETVFFAWVYLDPKNPPSALMVQLNDGDWNQRGVWGSDQIAYGLRKKNWAGYLRKGKLPSPGEWTRLELSAQEIGLATGKKIKGMAFTQYGGTVFWDAAGWVSTGGIPLDVSEALAVAPDKRTKKQLQLVKNYYFSNASVLQDAQGELKKREALRKRLEDSMTKTVISRSVKPRTIRILDRGNWMDDSGAVVTPAIPEFLGELKSKKQLNRLDLANWITDPENKLTSRVMVNRLWYLMFGRGICASVDDLGGQGTYPSNAALLDWLAYDFAHSGWDIKKTLKLIVMSSTYQQDSKASPELLKEDPNNELFARQGRFRVDAEMVRDTVLYVSGLLVEKVGGRSVKPYQPSGYYRELNFPRRTYKADQGTSQYRRGVYTHWQRTFLHPMLKAFDAPSREESTCTRARSNTPLQALTLLNDPTFVESARVYASKIIRVNGSVESKIEWAFQNAVSRLPSPEIVQEIKTVFEKHLKQFQSDLESASKLIQSGQAAVDKEHDPAELAAWTSVARIVLNLHELTTRF